jgi:hypothetical protein
MVRDRCDRQLLKENKVSQLVHAPLLLAGSP